MNRQHAHPLAAFALLDHAQQLAAIRRLAAGGATDGDISRLTGLHPEQVRRAIAQHDDKREGHR